MLNFPSVSSCVKCGGGTFKVVEKEPAGSNYKLNFVQCSTCSTPISALEYFNIGAKQEEQKEAINRIEIRLSNIEQTLSQIANFLNQRR